VFHAQSFSSFSRTFFKKPTLGAGPNFRNHRRILTQPWRLFRKKREKTKQKLKCEFFFGFPEFLTMAAFAELHKSINFAVTFTKLRALQRAKNLLRYGKQKEHENHPDASFEETSSLQLHRWHCSST
jgi:hypothetical protein